MFPPSDSTPPPAPDPADEAAFEAHLQQMIAGLPVPLLNNLHILLTGCVQAALALWREPGVGREVIAEAETLSGLTEAWVRQTSQIQDAPAVGRLLLTSPVRLHALTALGLALLDTPLLDRFTRFMTRPDGDFAPETWGRIRVAARDIGTKLMTQFEDRTAGALYDVEDLLAERAGDLPEAPRYTGEVLRLRRMQLEGFVERNLADYIAPDVASPTFGDEVPGPVTSDDASIPDAPEALDERFQQSLLSISFLESQLAMLQLALRLPLALRLLPDHRFGEAARALRWLRQPRSLETLLTRFEALEPEATIALTTAELLRLYQGTQFTALALVGDVMRDLDEFLSQPAANGTRLREPMQLSEFFNAPPDAEGDSPRRAIFGMVEGFVEMVREVIKDDMPPEATAERAALQAAQTEIDELSNLV